jgi:glyceraldehyde 3-phosphate dehydrogenase
MKRAAIVGFGRIGRAIFRANHKKKYFEIAAINDINPDINNLSYLLQYDSHYGRFEGSVSADDRYLVVDGCQIPVFCETNISTVDWKNLEIDVVIDASGVHDNVLAAPKLIADGVPKIVITHSPDEVDHTIVFGVNENTYRPDEHNVVSSSICDAVAVAPVLRVIHDAVGIDSGFLTTLHPWLSYQNVLDGPSISWASPGTIYHHYAVGRASPGCLIPKPTSAVEATVKVLPEIDGLLQCMSFRIPTPVVGIANIYLQLSRGVEIAEVHSLFEEAARNQSRQVFSNNIDPLVSVDFVGSPFSAVVDHRWTALAGDRHLNLVLWYDNEWGYSSRVLDVAQLVVGASEDEA